MVKYTLFIVKFLNELFLLKFVLLKLVLVLLNIGIGIGEDIFFFVLLDELCNNSIFVFIIDFIIPLRVLGLGNCIFEFEFIIISPDFFVINFSNSFSNASVIFLKFFKFFIYYVKVLHVCNTLPAPPLYFFICFLVFNIFLTILFFFI